MVRAIRAGLSRHAAARSFEVSASWVIKLMRQVETTGDGRPRKLAAISGTRWLRMKTAHEDKVRGLVAARPGLTITELGQKLMALAIKAGRFTAGRLLPHLQLAIGL
ncbi:MAG: hypothetical protein M3Z96_09560 [Pseudomonadota bacterium]|nr:hypothetical protein [Pseudomonadota bacterium]